MSLRFVTTRGPEPEGSFRPADPKAFRRAEAKCSKLASAFYLREVSAGACREACGGILDRDPLELNALSLYLDARLSEPGGLSENLAQDAASRMRPFLELVGGFRGGLDPSSELTAHFLGCHHALTAATVWAGKYREALEMCLRHAGWDAGCPDGAWAYAGNLMLMLGRLDEAEAFFTSPPVPMPYESAYGEALLRFLQGRHAEAAGVLRRAAITQPYVAEIILRRARGPVPAWKFPDGRALFYSAMSYADAFLGAKIWELGDGEAARFLSWVYNSPGMMAERAEALSILSAPGPGAAPAELAAARDEFIRFSLAHDPGLARSLTDPVEAGGTLVRPWEAPEGSALGGRADSRARTGPDGRAESRLGEKPARGARPGPRAKAGGSYPGRQGGAPAPEDAACPGRNRRLRPVSSELADAGDSLSDLDWIFASAGGEATGRPEAAAGSGAPGEARLSGRGSAVGASAAASGRSAASGNGPGDVPGKGGNANGNSPGAPSKAPDDPRRDDGAPAPEGIGKGRARSDGWEPWSPSAPPGGEWESEEGDDEPDCGDCEVCEVFDQCSQSLERQEDECDECSECEIEGFCRPAPPTPKDPPFRH
ncbi:MAG: hypothetical protein LBQ12_13110 [Deltaproteobacteria bacterium]|jgi:hypothetical protein|nr:hypothetical protein [Deltaproteobacteria bacterium]